MDRRPVCLFAGIILTAYLSSRSAFPGQSFWESRSRPFVGLSSFWTAQERYHHPAPLYTTHGLGRFRAKVSLLGNPGGTFHFLSSVATMSAALSTLILTTYLLVETRFGTTSESLIGVTKRADGFWTAMAMASPCRTRPL